jgi:hypothetical protein
VRSPGKPVWLSFDPPRNEPPQEESAYKVAIADSAVSGARWIVSLDEGLAAGLAAGNAEAAKKWRGITATLAFFEKHRQWAAWEPWGPLGVLSSFAGEDEFMGQEVLNLAARRNLLFRILDRTLPESQKFESLRAVLYVDNDPPAADLQSRLAAFTRAGGLLIAQRATASRFPAAGQQRCPVAGYELRTFGKGAVAAAVRDWDDPYFLAADVHSLVSRRNDPFLLFNGSSLLAHYSVARSGGAALLQLVSFASHYSESVSVAAPRWRAARMHTMEAEQPATLEPIKVEGQTEFHLPRFSGYTALEFQP